MKRIYFTPAFLLTVFLFASCTTVYKYNQDFSEPDKLEKGEGIVVFRIFNETAGKSIPLADSDGNVLIDDVLNLKSDIELVKPMQQSCLVRNDESPVQYVCIALDSGFWGVNKIGKNSEYDYPSYSFTVEEGVVNYVGDFYISLVEGDVPLFALPKDWYTLSVADNHDAAYAEFLSRYPALSSYEMRNSASNTEELFPKFCNINTEKNK